MNIKSDLKLFYNSQAEKYSNTRKKYRPDSDIIIEEIRKYWKKTISILEFGCGSWRLIAYLQWIKWIKIKYTGIDTSDKLLNFAEKEIKKNKTDYKLINDDIVNYVKEFGQETFDFIIGTSSFQHIPTAKERFFLMKNFYRILKYNWKVIIINRSFSRWFIRKYINELSKWVIRFLISFWKKDRKDLFIPRKANDKVYPRFYHIYTIPELENLSSVSWLVVDKLWYLDQQWKIINKRQNAKSSILIWGKSIFLQK